MNNSQIIENTIAFVKKTLQDAEGGHDWFHIQRVYNNAKQIASKEDADALVVALGALLHDIADSKFHEGDESVGPRMAKEFLQEQQVETGVVEHVVKIIEGLERAYEKLVEYKRYKKSPLIISRNGEVIEVSPEDIPPTTRYKRGLEVKTS